MQMLFAGRDLLTGELLAASYWANRAGNIAATQLPLMVVLAGKNNLLSRKRLLAHFLGPSDNSHSSYWYQL
jgi:hypothetical protein